MMSRRRQSFFTWKLLPVAALLLAAAAPAAAGSPAASSNVVPAQITTADGRTYHAVKLLQVLPDGLLVQYLPNDGGIGFARLKFVKLAASFQKQFGYNPEKASAYEQAEKLAMTELSRRMREDEDIRTATLIETARSSVIVEAGPPLVHYAYYDPAGAKPAGISEGMSGDKEYYFICNPIFKFRVAHQGAGEPFDFHIETVTMQLGVTININLPKGQIGKLRKHEDGHKEIVEYFYSLGPVAARQAGELVTGLEQTSSAPDYDAAKTEVFTKAGEEVQTAYLKSIQTRCEEANNYYDELTDHGRNRVDSNQAAREAIRHYAPRVVSSITYTK